MNGDTWGKRVFIKHGLRLLLLLEGVLSFFPAPVFAADCEILKQRMFQREQSVIVMDWDKGVPYRRLKTEVYPCAYLTIRNNSLASVYSKDIEVTATFIDQSTKSKKIEGDGKRIERGDEYFCSVCFESDYSISKLECNFR